MTTYNATSLSRTLASLIGALVLSTVTLAATTSTGPAPAFAVSAGHAIALPTAGRGGMLPPRPGPTGTHTGV